mmetsp:Transcript_140537/g.449195  ORF Transcript_140537/g.449195 Transcript_140537/m.449195 type:complete len:193 (-) Transcript_140537:357-935(-)
MISTIAIGDSDIGTKKNGHDNNLGTVARSGTMAFAEAMAAGGGASMTGQIGVGVYKILVVDNCNDDGLGQDPRRGHSQRRREAQLGIRHRRFFHGAEAHSPRARDDEARHQDRLPFEEGLVRILGGGPHEGAGPEAQRDSSASPSSSTATMVRRRHAEGLSVRSSAREKSKEEEAIDSDVASSESGVAVASS